MTAGEPSAAPGPESEAEVEHLLALAESELSAGRLRTARRHALRACRLYPSCRRASVVATSANVLLSDASSHYAALLLPDPYASPLSTSELRRHFKSLVKSLRVGPDYAADYPSSAGAAQEALCRATEAYEALTSLPAPGTFWAACAGCRRLHEFDRKYVGYHLICSSCRLTFLAAEEAFCRATEAYEALTAPPPPGTFWTACAGCRLLHEFDRKYVGYRLICPSCRLTFLAVEVPSPPEAEGPARLPSPRRPPPPAKKPDKLEMTLQLAKKKRGANAPESSSRDVVVVSDEDDEEEEAEAQNSHSVLMAVEKSDFYNFDAKRRAEKCFKTGQVWALYGDADGMPRHYALVAGVQRATQFRVQIWWLDGEEEGKTCGQFKVGRSETVDSVNVFSHLVGCVRVSRQVYRVYPRKSSAWALHRGEEGDAGKTKYDIVVMLSGYVEWCGASFVYLKKVEGYRCMFTCRDVESVHVLQNGDLGRLSHQIPARKVPEGKGYGLPPGDFWELDPAALPPELLHRHRMI